MAGKAHPCPCMCFTACLILSAIGKILPQYCLYHSRLYYYEIVPHSDWLQDFLGPLDNDLAVLKLTHSETRNMQKHYMVVLRFSNILMLHNLEPLNGKISFQAHIIEQHKSYRMVVESGHIV